MYTTFYLFVLGVLLLTANWFIGAPLLIGLTLIVVTRLRNEEAAMTEKFGDSYREYIRHTGRFLPRITSPAQAK
jgi:protein-S-isoprenylcysteine O-methyltransferase Ste14